MNLQFKAKIAAAIFAALLCAVLFTGLVSTPASAHALTSNQQQSSSAVASNSCWGWQFWVLSYYPNRTETYMGHCNVMFLSNKTFQTVYQYIFGWIKNLGVPSWIADQAAKQQIAQWNTIARADRGCGVYVYQYPGGLSAWSAC